MNATHSYRWKPLDDLPDDSGSLSDEQTVAMARAWQDQNSELKARASLDPFLERLKRQWSVETGAIEEVYRISEGATRTLIERGLDAAFISSDDVDDTPTAVVAKIHDQMHAVNGLYQFVSTERPLTKSFLLEMHQVITAHQDYYEARDSLGQRVPRPLQRGAWKKLPNNVEGPNGYVFEFCPPEQVESEIDRLLTMYRRHTERGVSPEVEAAWLHHRFTLIHPFTDGNGRMARCLATLVLLKADWLPLVVTRNDKAKYISALREADRGELSPFIRLIGDLQRKAVREALSIGREALQETARWQGVLDSIRSRFEKRKQDVVELVRRSYRTADTLHALAQDRLEVAAKELDPLLKAADREYQAYSSGAANGEAKAHYNTYQVVEAAKKLGYFANLNAYRSWSAMTIVADSESRTDFLVSIHAVGRGETGVLACSAMTYTRRKDELGSTAIGEIHTSDPFEFTYAEDPDNVQRRFQAWLEERIVSAVARWSDELG